MMVPKSLAATSSFAVLEGRGDSGARLQETPTNSLWSLSPPQKNPTQMKLGSQCKRIQAQGGVVFKSVREGLGRSWLKSLPGAHGCCPQPTSQGWRNGRGNLSTLGVERGDTQRKWVREGASLSSRSQMQVYTPNDTPPCTDSFP